MVSAAAAIPVGMVVVMMVAAAAIFAAGLRGFGDRRDARCGDARRHHLLLGLRAARP